MKTVFIFTLVIFIFILFLGFPLDSKAVEKLHSYENYKTTYKLEGVKSGEKIVCSRNWGMEKVQIDRVKIQTPDGIKSINQKLINKFKDGEMWKYGINLDTNEGKKVKDPKFPELLKEMSGKDPASFAKSLLKEHGGEVIGQKKILGRKCDVWKVAGIETCVSDKGIALELKIKNPKIVETATSIDTKNTCSSETFSLGNAKIEEIDITSQN